ncbi:MAG: hypothetical protein Q9M26_00215 [Mariprofundales bacterium]|nr:hypothetical protein [Mariprofundales bacterium]
MAKMFFGIIFLFSSFMAIASEQATIQVDNLPMAEAESLAKSVLSAHGTVASLPSQRLLVLQDDAKHIQAARKLLQQFDRPSDQFRLTVELEQREALDDAQLQAAAKLPGDWLRLPAGGEAEAGVLQASTIANRHWSLLLQTNRAGSITLGQVQPQRSVTRQWLEGYGLLAHDSVNLVSFRSGFAVRLQAAGNHKVEVKITPWLARSQPGMPASARPELLLGLGSVGSVLQAPTTDNAPLRLNAAPQLAAPQPVRIVRAATTVAVKPGEEVELVSAGGEAELFSQALLGRYSHVGAQSLVIHLRVERL